MTTHRTLSFLLLFAALGISGIILITELPSVHSVHSAPEVGKSTELKGSSVALLKDGRLLVSGGTGEDNRPAAIVQLFKDGVYSAAQGLIKARSHHASVTLQDGRVLVTGGSTSSGATNETEIYDPKTNDWHVASPMSLRRIDHTATLLPDGSVLVAGGGGSADAAMSVEIYHPKTKRFSIVGRLTTARVKHAAGLSQGGKVIISGGTDASGNEIKTAEVFDPMTGVSTPDRSVLRKPAAASGFVAWMEQLWLPEGWTTR